MWIGGNDDNMVSFFELKKAYNQLKSDHDATVTELNKLKDDFNTFVSVFNSHVHPFTGAVNIGLATCAGTTSASGTSGTPSSANGQNSTGDIEPAKLVNIKTKKP